MFAAEDSVPRDDVIEKKGHKCNQVISIKWLKQTVLYRLIKKIT